MKKQLFVYLLVFLGMVCISPSYSLGNEAPAGFDDSSNGYVSDERFAEDRDVFDEVEDVEDGLGPLYNAQSCRECRQNPISGSSSQITELRAGHMEDGAFQNPEVPIMHGRVIISGRSVINDRAICPGSQFPSGEIQERVPLTETIRTFSTSLNLLGDGFVEAIDDQTLGAEGSLRSAGIIEIERFVVT